MPFKNLEHDSMQEKKQKIRREEAIKAKAEQKEVFEKEAVKKKIQHQKEWLNPSNPWIWNPIDLDD